MCLDINAKDIEAQRQFANLVASVTIESDIHLHLVAHPRKAVSVEQEPDLNDVAGGADYGRLAHNVAFLRRGASALANHLSPMKIAVRKQRYTPAYHGDIDGWFNREIRQFKVEQFDQMPTQYLPKAAYDQEH
jgi:twinkle protein